MPKRRIWKRYRTKKKGGQHYWVQTLIFPKSEYTQKQALGWARKHGFKHYTSRVENDEIRVRQFPPSQIKKVKGSFYLGDIKGLYVSKKQNYSDVPLWKKILDSPETERAAKARQELITLQMKHPAYARSYDEEQEIKHIKGLLPSRLRRSPWNLSSVPKEKQTMMTDFRDEQKKWRVIHKPTREYVKDNGVPFKAEKAEAAFEIINKRLGGSKYFKPVRLK